MNYGLYNGVVCYRSSVVLRRLRFDYGHLNFSQIVPNLKI